MAAPGPQQWAGRGLGRSCPEGLARDRQPAKRARTGAGPRPTAKAEGAPTRRPGAPRRPNTLGRCAASGAAGELVAAPAPLLRARHGGDRPRRHGLRAHSSVGVQGWQRLLGGDGHPSADQAKPALRRAGPPDLAALTHEFRVARPVSAGPGRLADLPGGPRSASERPPRAFDVPDRRRFAPVLAFPRRRRHNLRSH